MTSTPSPDDYFLEIEGHFAMRRRSPFILSAMDWALMKKWREEEIPLAVVIEAIDQVFENNETSGRRKVISSLSYCRHAVKELWTERKELYAGAPDASPEEHSGPMLEALAAQLEQSDAPKDIVAAVAADIRALTAEKTVPKIEEQLIDVEHRMITRILEAVPEAAAEVRAAVALAVGDPSKVDEKTRARTEEANLRRIVRERFGLPRLTLFR